MVFPNHAILFKRISSIVHLFKFFYKVLIKSELIKFKTFFPALIIFLMEYMEYEV